MLKLIGRVLNTLFVLCVPPILQGFPYNQDTFLISRLHVRIFPTFKT